MNERQKRLNEVYEHLRRFYGIHTKTAFAKAVKFGRTSMSAALNGNESYLTDALFKSICDAYEGVFNLGYLLTGEGELLTIEEDVTTERLQRWVDGERAVTPPDFVPMIAAESEPDPQPFIPQWADTLISIMSKQIKENETLNAQLRQSLAEVAELKSQLSDLISELKTK